MKYRAVRNASSNDYDTIDIWTIQKRYWKFWVHHTTKTFPKNAHTAVAQYLASLRNPLIIEETP